jgi:POT family proton-dependent oligopeptide transporter
VARIEAAAAAQGQALPRSAEGTAALAGLTDPWSQPLRYTLLNSETARLSSAGPDQRPDTRWDLGVVLSRRATASDVPTNPTWLDRRKAELGIQTTPAAADDPRAFDLAWYAGGQTRLEGSAYFWFFTALMAATAGLFIGAARFYRGRDYVADEEPLPAAGLREESC